MVKKNKRKRKDKIGIDDVHKKINKVQVQKKTIVFATNIEESPTIENIIKDANVEYKKDTMKTQVVFTMLPSEDTNDLHLLDIDFLSDEIPEEGQIFG